MINYENLPSAPSKEEREEMIEDLKALPDYVDNEVHQAFINNIRLGFIVIVRDDLMCITKEGYDYFQMIERAELN